MLVTAAVLRALGPVLGWERAERLWLGVLVVGLMAALGRYVRGSAARGSALAPLLLAWVPLGWITAWGFYDFLLGMILFTVLLDGLEHGGIPPIVGVLTLLYVTHLFAFAAAAGALVVRALDRPDLRLTAAGVVAAGTGLILTAPGLGGGIAWDFSFRARLIQLALGGTLLSVSPVALMGGAVWTALIVAGAVRLRLDWRSRVGLLLLAGSVIAPRAVGTGVFVFERLHILGLIALAPLVVTTAARIPLPVARTVGVLMAGGLVAVFAVWSHTGRQLDRDRQRITTLLEAAGVGPGDAVTSAFPHARMARYRAPLYFHLVDRSARERSAIVADNYQAAAVVFPVTWVEGRSAVRAWQDGDEWAVRGAWDAPLYVVHRADARWRGGHGPPLVADDRFAVTRVRRYDGQVIGPPGSNPREIE
jgi:hypothetical protein